MDGCVDDIRSTSGSASLLGDKLVTWLIKKIDYIIKYIIVASCCTQEMWMKKTLKDVKMIYEDPIPIMPNNTSAINILKNMVMHLRTKHISI